MKRTDPQSLQEIIHEVFARAGMAENEARQRALSLWGEIVGPGVNRYTSRRYVTEQGVMHVYITSAALKADLQYMRADIMRRLNEAVGSAAITDLLIH